MNRDDDRREAFAAWTVYGLMLAAGLWFVAVYGFTIPHGDEWEWLPVVAGQQPVSLAWLWSMHNEHRMVVPRLIYLGLGEITGFDFRAGAVFNILALSGLALALMLAARRLRGRTSVYDAFFPLLLLHWAQCENIAWGFQLNFITSVVLVGVVLLIIVGCGPQLAIASAGLATVCLVALGLCGLYGLAYLPALACWLAFAGIWRWRDGATHARRDGLVLIGCAFALAALVAGYFVGFRQSNPRTLHVWASLSTALQFLSGGIGPGARNLARLGHTRGRGLRLRTLATVPGFPPPTARAHPRGGAVFSAWRRWLLGLGRRRRSRQEGAKAGFMERYMTLGTPLLCLLYLQFTLYSSPAVKVHLQRTLALLMLGLLLVNMPKGLRYANDFQQVQTMLEADMRAGLSSADLALRHGDDLGFAPPNVFAWRLDMLRAARLGPYRDAAAQPDPSLSVRRFCELTPSRQAAVRPRLLPGHCLTQSFHVPAGWRLYRIDVQISRCRSGRTLDHLNWALYAAAAGQPRRVLARDSIDLRPVDRDDYVSLTIPADSLGTASAHALGETLLKGTVAFSSNQERASAPLVHSPGARTERFALVFTSPADAPPNYGVELPLYRCASQPAARWKPIRSHCRAMPR